MAAKRSKRRTRVLIVAASMLALSGAGVAGWLVVRSRNDDLARQARADGVVALQKQDYKAALESLAVYVQRFADRGTATGEDYFLLARARRRVVAEGNRQVMSAITLLRRSLDLDPTSFAARQELLELYMETDYSTEALELIETLLAHEPGRIDLLRDKADVLASLHRFAEAIPFAKEVEGAPGAVIGDSFRTLRLLVAAEASSADIDTWIAQAIAAHAADARYELLRAVILTQRRDARAKESFDRIMASEAATGDPEIMVMLVSELDAAERFPDSLKVLERAEHGADANVLRELVRRLWWAGRLPDAAARLDASPIEEVKADPEMIALRTLALAASGRGADAEPGRAALKARTDPVGAAWSACVESSIGDAEAKRTLVPALRRGVAAVPTAAFLRQALGDAYAAMGESDAALQAWSDAAARAKSWAVPLRRIARTLLATPGMEHLAPGVARAAFVLAPTDSESIVTWIEARASVVDAMDRKQVGLLLDTVTTLQQQAPEQAAEALPAYVELLARVDKTAAENLIRQTLVSPTPRSESTLIRLAQAASRAGIPLESSLLDLSENLHGVTPQLAFARALARSRSGGDEAGLRILTDLRNRRRPDTADIDWELVRLSYLDAVGRSEAGAAWIAFADARPAVLPVQLGALASAGVWNDRAAVARIIERVRGITGDEAVTWRVARARLLLSATEASADDIAEAAKTLSAVVVIAPKSVAARLLLAQAFQRLGNLPGAEEQLTAAAELAPENAWIALELARLAQLQQRPEVARRQLDRLLTAHDLVPEQVERVAYLLAMQGERRRSAELLEPLAAKSQARRDGILLLAQLYAKLGETARAISLCERLLTTGDSQVIELAASLYASAGRPGDADAALSRLDTGQFRAGEKELVRARHATAFGTPAAAVDWFRKAVAAAPDRADAWNSYLQFVVATGDAAEFVRILDAPAAASVGAVAALRASRDLLAGAVKEERTRALVLGMIDDAPARASLLSAMTALAGGWDDPAKRAGALTALCGLAEANVRVLPLQLVAASHCAAAGDAARAVDFARRAMMQFPNSAAAARLAAELLASGGRWKDALDAGGRWRDRTTRQDVRPELLVAQALLHLDRPQDAAAGLEPLVAAALMHPDRSDALLTFYMVALVRSNRVARVSDLLGELAVRDRTWRKRALEVDPFLLGDASSALAWLRTAQGTDPDADDTLRLPAAKAWAAAWIAFRGDTLLAGARAAVERATAGDKVPAEAWFVAGSMAQAGGDLDAAERDYRAALAADAGHLGARNNLAMVLADSGHWKEAVTQADAVVKAAPGAANCLDTLAYAHRKGREFDAARAALEGAIRLEPGSPEWRIGLTETLVEAGRMEEARKALESVDSIVAGGANLSPDVRTRLDRVRDALR